MEIENNLEQYEKLIGTVSSEVFCVFKTNLADKYKIPEDRFTISSNMTDKDLNMFVCQQIQAENDLEEEVNYHFEFLLKNDFIKGTLKSHLIKHQIAAEEKTIEIHYCFALEKPKLSKTIQEDDWVWEISKFSGAINDRAQYGVAHFDGSVAIYNEKGQRITNSQVAEDSSIRTLRIIPNVVEEDSYYVITGSNDEAIRINSLKLGKAPKFEAFAKGMGHEGSIECIDNNPINSTLFASGGTDKTLRIWKFEHRAGAVEAVKGSKPTKKVKPTVEQIEANHSADFHNDEISKLVWARSETIITGSQDHTIRFYDTVKMRETGILDCKDNAVTALAHNDNMIISGHEDGYIKVWDEKSGTKQPIKILKAHGKWISSAKYHPNNPLLFLTGSYDSTVKLWDFRSTFPLVNLKDQKEKIFSVEWNGDSQFLSGGSDSKIMCYNFENQDK